MKRVHAAALLCASLLAVGCEDEARVWIDGVSADSAAATLAEQSNEHDGAREALERLLGREAPSEVAREDVRVVQQDAHERLARIHFVRGDTDRASAEVARGLSLGEREDVFTANLLTLRGRIHERAGRDREAAADYHRALRIHEALLDRVLGR